MTHGPEANGRPVSEGILLQAGLALEEVLGLEVALVIRAGGEERLPARIEGLEVQDGRGVIGSVNAGDLIVAGAAVNRIARVGFHLPGELHIRRGERLAIGPLQARLEVPGDGQAIRGNATVGCRSELPLPVRAPGCYWHPMCQANQYALVDPGGIGHGAEDRVHQVRFLRKSNGDSLAARGEGDRAAWSLAGLGASARRKPAACWQVPEQKEPNTMSVSYFSPQISHPNQVRKKEQKKRISISFRCVHLLPW